MVDVVDSQLNHSAEENAASATPGLFDDSSVTSGLLNDQPFPLVLSARKPDTPIVSWCQNNRERVNEGLRAHGAVLFRGFQLDDKERFEAFVSANCDKLIANYSDLPEEKGSKVIYGSTPYPRDKTIFFHNESSHLDCWPLRQFFACVTASKEGGETPIADCRAIYTHLPPGFREKWEAEGLLYVRNFIPGLDVRWQDFFKTDSKEQVSIQCELENLKHEWREKDYLRISRVSPAINTHPVTEDSIFFNQLQLHHTSFLDESERDANIQLFGVEGLPRNVYFGDGTPIEDHVAKEIYQLYERFSVKFLWQAGDLLMLDNMLMAHARLPFEGPRKIIVAMGDMQHESDYLADSELFFI